MSDGSVAHAEEVAKGERFQFGENWKKFLLVLDDERIAEAEASLKAMLGAESLAGRKFLDIGSGSGLFSLAARRLGAEVVSFDYDTQSVACTTELKRRFFNGDANWKVAQGSVLDQAFLRGLGTFDIVYSWGVLHHTGKMWEALANAANLVSDGGLLFIAIYNDQGWPSRVWLKVKQAYVALPHYLKWLVVLPSYVVIWGPVTIVDLVTLRPFAKWRSYKRRRGMSPAVDLIDWVGGLPFEVASPEQIFEFYYKRGFGLRKLKTCKGRLGCNEFVFGLNCRH